jgi:hypothetical protein
LQVAGCAARGLALLASNNANLGKLLVQGGTVQVCAARAACVFRLTRPASFWQGLSEVLTNFNSAAGFGTARSSGADAVAGGSQKRARDALQAALAAFLGLAEGQLGRAV